MDGYMHSIVCKKFEWILQLMDSDKLTNSYRLEIDKLLKNKLLET